MKVSVPLSNEQYSGLVSTSETPRYKNVQVDKDLLATLLSSYSTVFDAAQRLGAKITEGKVQDQ